MKINTKDKIVQKVFKKMDERSLIGQCKYKSTMYDEIKTGKKDLFNFLTDVQEELMDAILYIESAKSFDKKIGITFSCFDLFHAGHVLMLEEAKSQCDYLIVGLQLDPSIERSNKNKPTQTIIERYTQLKACEFIDEIIPYTTEEDLLNILISNKIHVRIIGEEYKDKYFTGKKYCEENNIKIYYNNRKHNYSTTNLKKQINERNNKIV